MEVDTVAGLLPVLFACAAAILAILVLFLYLDERRKHREKDGAQTQRAQQLGGQLRQAEQTAAELARENEMLWALMGAAEETLVQGDAPAGLVAYEPGTGRQLLGGQTQELLRSYLAEQGEADTEELLQNKCPGDSAVIAVKRGEKTGWIELRRKSAEKVELYTVKDITAATSLRNLELYERRYDKLTGIYNQPAFLENARELFSEKNRLGVSCVLVLRTEYMEGYGTGVGHGKLEEYIKACAAVLKRYSGSGMFSRHSNGEFYGILYGYPSRQLAEDTLNQIWTGVSRATAELGVSTESFVRVNIGVSWYPEDSERFEELVSYANFCVYIARKNGTYGLEFFDRAVFLKDGYLLNGRAGFAEMVEKKLVRFAFQPIVEVATAKIYGYELLMRPQHPQLRNMSDVLNLAVVQGCTHEIEQLTWFEGMRAFAQLVESGRIRYDAKAFVNSIGGTCLTEREHLAFTEQYYDYLKNIVTEITESQQESEECIAIKRKRVADWGAQLAIDDYGTGYNSEVSLLFFRPSIVKVDIAFVHGIDQDADKQMLFQNLVRYAKERDISVLAEGVETAEELKTVIQFGADYIQGYYLAMPDFVPKELSAKHVKTIGEIRYGEKRG